MISTILACALAMVQAPPVTFYYGQGARSHATNPRLLVLTDISSLTPGVREPDDGQSMIRLMLYSNEFDIEGLVASSNMQHGQVVRPELIREVIAAYGQVVGNLRSNAWSYPPAVKLMKCVKSGQPVAGPKTPVFNSIGPGKDTEASEWIIRVVDRRDSRPIWVVVWGGTADLAQALWKVRSTRTPKEAAAFVSRIRIHTIGYQDSTGEWIAREFPSLYIILQGNSMRGMYRGGDTSLSSSEWVDAHLHGGQGALGALYPNYNGGDIWGSVRGVKEGDTPSFLSLIPNGLNVPEEPELGGWGGRFRRVGVGRYVDVEDIVDGDRAAGMETVYRWRQAYQADFAARLEWCVKAPGKANHPPDVRIRGSEERRVASGGVVELDARGSNDPDGDKLTYQWSIYPDSPDSGRFDNPISPQTRFHPAPTARGRIHLLLTVRDNGLPALTQYARVVVFVPVTEKGAK